MYPKMSKTFSRNSVQGVYGTIKLKISGNRLSGSNGEQPQTEIFEAPEVNSRKYWEITPIVIRPVQRTVVTITTNTNTRTLDGDNSKDTN